MIGTGYFSKPMDGYYCGMPEENFTVTPEGRITSCVEVSRINEPYADKIIIIKINVAVVVNVNIDLCVWGMPYGKMNYH